MSYIQLRILYLNAFSPSLITTGSHDLSIIAMPLAEMQQITEVEHEGQLQVQPVSSYVMILKYADLQSTPPTDTIGSSVDAFQIVVYKYYITQYWCGTTVRCSPYENSNSLYQLICSINYEILGC